MNMSRYEILDAWLERVRADRLWVFEYRTFDVSGYSIAGQLAVVVRHADKHGWELLVPASKDHRTFVTLDAAAAILGVEGCRGLADGTTNSANAGPVHATSG
jgi:hypothetical protein